MARHPVSSTGGSVGWWRVALVAACLLLASAVPGAAQEDFGVELARVKEIRFEGVHSVDRGTLRKVLKTKARSRFAFWRERPLLRQDFLRADVRNLELSYARNGFLDASAEARVERDEESNLVAVVYTVVEGRQTRVRSLTWAGSFQFTDEHLSDKILTRVGEPMNPIQLANDQDRIAALYADRGHFPAVRAEWTRDSLAADVRFTVAEGRAYSVGEIRVEGVQTVDTFAVRRELLVHEGELFRRDEVLRSVERLYGSSLFQVVDFSPARIDTLHGVVDLKLDLRERKHKRIEGGVGVSSRDGFRVVGSWSNLNLSGRGNRLNASASVWFSGLGGTETRVSYTEPWIFGVRLSGQVGAFVNQSRLLFRGAEYTERNYGPTVSVLREVGRYTRLVLSSEAKWSHALTTPNLPPEDLEIFREDYFTTSVSFATSYDDRDDKFDARRGQVHRAAVEVGNILSGARDDFYKFGATGGWHIGTGERSCVSVRIQVGRMWPFADADAALRAVPASDLFRTGGSSSVRGYAELELAGADSLGGLMEMVTNVEYRFPIVSILSGALFVDGGNVWSRPTEWKFDQLIPPKPGTVLEENQMRWSAGGGVRVSSPVGPLRLDLGYRLYREPDDLLADPPSRLGFSFSFGQVF